MVSVSRVPVPLLFVTSWMVFGACFEAETGGLGAGAGRDAGRSADLASDSGQDLGTQDLGGADLGSDLGVFDAGSDLGPDGGVLARCSQASVVLLAVRTDETGTVILGPNADFRGRGTVVFSHGGFVQLALEDGTRLELRATNEGLDVELDRIRLGERLDVVFDFEDAVDFHVVLRSPTAGSVVAALWSAREVPFTIRLGVEFEVASEPTDCRHVVPGCPAIQGRNLVVTSEGVRTEVPVATQVPLGRWRASHGFRYDTGLGCPGPNNFVSAGTLLPSSTADVCTFRSRDACIASPDCALHGSEAVDPEYVCLPAAFDCERFDRLGCRASERCTWDEGDCYCPENADCACAGGRPPICRLGCDATIDIPECEGDPSYFCQVQPRVGALLCSATPQGSCVRVPDSCAGVPPTAPAVCGCIDPAGNPATYDNDCRRRRSRAFAVPNAVCE